MMSFKLNPVEKKNTPGSSTPGGHKTDRGIGRWSLSSETLWRPGEVTPSAVRRSLDELPPDLGLALPSVSAPFVRRPEGHTTAPLEPRTQESSTKVAMAESELHKRVGPSATFEPPNFSSSIGPLGGSAHAPEVPRGLGDAAGLAQDQALGPAAPPASSSSVAPVAEQKGPDSYPAEITSTTA